jgi:transposase
MRPYSTDLRERVVAAIDHHEGTLRQIARTFRVSLSFIVRLLQRRRAAGTLTPKPHGGGPPQALGPDDRQRLAALIQEQPDAALKQLKQRGGFTCSLKTLWLALRHSHLTHKKKSLHASEQDRPDVQKKRRSFRRQVREIEPERLIFVDETGVTTAMTPAYAWAERGARAVDAAPATWETVTVIAALGQEGVRAPLVFPGATDTAVFQAYVDQVLVPELHKGDVVVLDNLKPHLTSGVAASIAKAGARVLPLPPYSPDYTPIEEMYSKVKGDLRRAAARTEKGLYDAVGQALHRGTRQDIRGWFQKAGLYATHG